MSELFGAPSGIIAHTQELDTKAATQQRFAQIEHMKALERQEDSRILLAQQKFAEERAAAARVLAQEQAKLQALAGGGEEMTLGPDGEPLPVADRLEAMSHRLLSAGYVKDAGDLAGKASTIRLNDQRAMSSAVLARTRLADQAAKAHEDLYNFMAASTDPASFNQAKLLYMAQHPEEEIPPELQQYNPQAIEVLRKTTKTGMEEAKRRAEAAKQEATEEYRKARLKQIDKAEEGKMERAHLNRVLRQTLAASRTKVEGKAPVVRAAGREMISAAQSMIRQDFPGLAVDIPLGKDNIVSGAAYDLANEAAALMANNRGMSAPEALGKVYAKMQAEGAFQTETVTTPPKKIGGIEIPFTGGEERKVTKYSRKGGAAASARGTGSQPTSPLPLPPKGTALRDGAYYSTPKGVVQWNATTKKAVLVPGGAGVRGAAAAVGGPADEDEEDEE